MLSKVVMLCLVLAITSFISGCGQAGTDKEDNRENVVHTQEDIERIEESAVAVSEGQKLYLGIVAASVPRACKIYDAQGTYLGKILSDNLTLVESFGGDYGIYCYKVGKDVAYVEVPDTSTKEYCSHILKEASDTSEKTAIVDEFLAIFGIQKISDSTVATLQGKSVLFIGDSITFGAGDGNNIYSCGGWPGRIGYYCKMSVQNNGVSQACISTQRSGYGSHYYIYSNLIKEANRTYDYIIMHGLYNDAGYGAPLGAPLGRANFDESKADPSNFAQALELLFYKAKQQNPGAKLGFIVNFDVPSTLDFSAYARMAIQICKDWDVQYLDLYTGSSQSMLADYTVIEMADEIHPSSRGYDKLYPIVADWMAQLK